MTRARRSDAGSASVWALSVGAIVMVVAVALSLIGAAIIARHRAGAAADLAALAGAQTLVAQASRGQASRGQASAAQSQAAAQGTACAAAEETAGKNGATLMRCQVVGSTVTVVVGVRARGLAAFGVGLVTATARAGPG